MPKFIAALFTIAKIWKQPQCLIIDKWIKCSSTAALTSVAQVVGCHPAKQMVAGSIPSQGTWVAGSVPAWGMYERQPINFLSLTLMFLTPSFSLPVPLSKNKLVKSFF